MYEDLILNYQKSCLIKCVKLVLGKWIHFHILGGGGGGGGLHFFPQKTT